MLNPKKQLSRRTDEEWYRLIMDCRKSGLSDSQFCQANGIPNSSFSTAVKRLRKKSFAIPEVTDVDIHDLTLQKQDVVKVDIIPDVQPPQMTFITHIERFNLWPLMKSVIVLLKYKWTWHLPLDLQIVQFSFSGTNLSIYLSKRIMDEVLIFTIFHLFFRQLNHSFCSLITR